LSILPAVLHCTPEVGVDDEIAATAKRLIGDALRKEWKPKIKALIEAICRKQRISWDEASDNAEFDIVTASEDIKLRALTVPHSEDEVIGWEISAQAMLLIIAEVRGEGPSSGTRI